jgi:hypothetical protein
MVKPNGGDNMTLMIGYVLRYVGDGASIIWGSMDEKRLCMREDIATVSWHSI